MKNQPEASELLAIARETYLAHIVPALAENLRYTALMIANAMAIAGREIQTGDAPARAELQRLRQLHAESAPESDERPIRSMLADQNRHLAREIRAGRYDVDNGALLDHLRKTTEEKLAISNPKALSGR